MTKKKLNIYKVVSIKKLIVIHNRMKLTKRTPPEDPTAICT